MVQSKTIVITGNHHTPAIELIYQLKKDQSVRWSICYISEKKDSDTHLNNTIIPDKDITFFNLNSGKFDRRQLLPSLTGIPKTFLSIFQSLNLLKKIRPDIVISFGGYSSVPVIITAWVLGIPSITHEQTLTTSLATKINGIFTTKIALSFNTGSLVSSAKTVVTGNLLRHEIYQNTFPSFLNTKLFNSKLPLIYITGGSQGSTAINSTILKTISKLKGFRIIHQTGPKDFSKFKASSNYIPVEYVTSQDIGWIFHHSNLIISRAGANTCQEIAVFGIPAILIPLPFSQQNEQLLNAKWLQQQSAVTVIPQEKFNSKNLISAINKMQKNKNKPLKKVGQTNNMFNLIHELAN